VIKFKEKLFSFFFVLTSLELVRYDVQVMSIFLLPARESIRAILQILIL